MYDLLTCGIQEKPKQINKESKSCTYREQISCCEMGKGLEVGEMGKWGQEVHTSRCKINESLWRCNIQYGYYSQ